MSRVQLTAVFYQPQPRFDVQKQCIAACGDRGVVDAHPLIAGADVLAASGVPAAQASDRLLSSTRCHTSVTRARLSNKKPPHAERLRYQLGTDF